MNRADVSIEVAHCDISKKIDREAVLRSIDVGNRLIVELAEAGLVCSVSVLIDDKYVGDDVATDNMHALLEFVGSNVERIDYVFRESGLWLFKEQMLSVLHPSVRSSIARKLTLYHTRHGRLACSHDIAIWHLLRLGVLDAENRRDLFVKISPENQIDFCAQRVVSVLSEKDRHAERRADRDILRYCMVPEVQGSIERIYV